MAFLIFTANSHIFILNYSKLQFGMLNHQNMKMHGQSMAVHETGSTIGW
jgi:hypothetical protein